MREAKRLLADKSLAVYEVAARVGFDDPYYFSKAFKKATGLSPAAFRREI
jgi:YesN/AraC family two-component response regulator